MRKIKIIMGVIVVTALAAIGLSNNAMATDVTIDKIELSFPVAVGENIPADIEATAYANNVAQSGATTIYKNLMDNSTSTIITSGTFEQKSYKLITTVDLNPGYNITCTSGEFQGTLTFNGEVITDEISSCSSSDISFTHFFDMREYYDISQLNFGISYPTSTSVAGDFSVTQLSSLAGVEIEYGGWYKYSEKCDFSGDLAEVFECWNNNGSQMDSDEGFTIGEQYTYVFGVSHPNFSFYNGPIVLDTLMRLPRDTNINGVPTLTGFMSYSVGSGSCYVFFDIPSLKDYLTITYDTLGLGTAPEAQTVAPNAVLTQPADPTAEGYVFEGWYYDEDYTRPVDFSMPITNDLTLYAKWTRISVPDAGEFTNIDTSSAAGSVFSVLGGVLAVAFIAITIRRCSDRK